MEYSVEYIYQDLTIDENRKELLKDLCEKIYAKVSPWRVLNAHIGNPGIIIIRFTRKSFISINNNNVVRFFDDGDTATKTKTHSWKTPADNDRIVITMLTLLSWDPQYIKFMKDQKKKSKIEQLMERIQIEVDYHPESETVKELSSNFNSMKK